MQKKVTRTVQIEYSGLCGLYRTYISMKDGDVENCSINRDTGSRGETIFLGTSKEQVLGRIDYLRTTLDEIEEAINESLGIDGEATFAGAVQQTLEIGEVDAPDLDPDTGEPLLSGQVRKK